MTQSLITTPFGATSTADEVIAGVDLTGKRAIVTGSSSGIGRETARALADAGAEVTLAVRNAGAGQEVAEDIIAATGNHRVHVAALELADRRSVRAFTGAWDGPVHILVNNAGIMATPEQRTAEGWEMQFATVGGLLAVEDGQRPFRGRGRPAVGRRRHHRQRAQPRPDRQHRAYQPRLPAGDPGSWLGPG
jgi:hypothetical protein